MRRDYVIMWFKGLKSPNEGFILAENLGWPRGQTYVKASSLILLQVKS